MSQNGKPHADREDEAKLAQKKVQIAEKHLGQICETIGSITRKSARLRDKGDLLARNLISFAEADQFNSSTRQGLLSFAENYAAVQDYSHAKVQRIEAKVLKPLTRYGEICRYIKRGIKAELSACAREKKALQKVEKAKEKTDNQSQLAQAEIELDRVQGEELVVGDAMEVEMDKFEMEKLLDVKKVLSELVKIEMLYHAKALECLSLCFENMQQVSVEADLDEFRAAMMKCSRKAGGGGRKPSDKGQVRIDASTLTSTGSTRRSLDTMGSSTFTSSQSSTLRSRQSPRVRISSNMYQDADDEDSEEYEDDD